MTPVFALSVVSALVYGAYFIRMPVGHLRAVAKTVPLVLLTFAAWLAGCPAALVAALCFSAAGDLFLAYQGECSFLLGLGSFLLAHLLFVFLFWHGTAEQTMPTPALVLAVVAIIAFGAAMFARLRPHLGKMVLPVAMYCTAIVAMAVLAVMRGFDAPLLAGVALFIASDTMLAHELFVFDDDASIRRWSRYFVWFAYFFGQALIVSAYL